MLLKQAMFYFTVKHKRPFDVILEILLNGELVGSRPRISAHSAIQRHNMSDTVSNKPCTRTNKPVASSSYQYETQDQKPNESHV